MKNLFNFILKNIHWLLFLLLLFLSILLIVKNSQFQRSKFLFVAQDVTGKIYSVTSGLQSYLNLNEINADLLKKIAELETEVYAYKRIMELKSDSIQTKSIRIDSLNILIYQFIQARVVNNNVSGVENYITLNRGSENGIEPDMGVMSANGVVGVIMTTSSHHSVVIPVLNPKFHLSCKVKNSNYYGPLVWDGKDARYTYLTELPRHVNFVIGDTIVTSGYSTIFPEGLPVGSIIDSQKQKDDNYNSVKIKLFTDFYTLNGVMIVKNSYQKEQKDLQKTVIQ
ncbi:MAG: rod shape-determining protein MreC [Dysgonamonadaceae bacterium]|nr:rod shape-determining protein MreC [Dysgonamonadaceae bacterium]